MSGDINGVAPAWVAPGSIAAQVNGCTCAVTDNHYGRGYMGQPGCYVITAGCPIHAPDKAPVPPSGELKGRKTDRPYTRKQVEPTQDKPASQLASCESNRRKTRLGR